MGDRGSGDALTLCRCSPARFRARKGRCQGHLASQILADKFCGNVERKKGGWPAQADGNNGKRGRRKRYFAGRLDFGTR